MASPGKEIVLITGGNGGIGCEIARQLVRDHGQKFHVIIGSRKLTDGENAVKRLQGEGLGDAVEAVQLDVTDEDSLAAAAKAVGDKFGRLDVLHANVSEAGASTPTAVGLLFLTLHSQYVILVGRNIG